MKAYHLQIVTPDRVVFDGNATSLTVRTTEGDVQIFAGHSDLVAAIGVGRAKFTPENEPEQTASAAGGFLTVTGEEVKLLTTTFELSSEIDVRRAEAAKERAEAALMKAQDEREERIAKAKLARALNRIRVGSGE